MCRKKREKEWILVIINPKVWNDVKMKNKSSAMDEMFATKWQKICFASGI